MQLTCDKKHFLPGCCCAAQVNRAGVTLQLGRNNWPADFADALSLTAFGSAFSNMAIAARLYFPIAITPPPPFCNTIHAAMCKMQICHTPSGCAWRQSAG